MYHNEHFTFYIVTSAVTASREEHDRLTEMCIIGNVCGMKTDGKPFNQ